jgi:FkbM family methyltransferase
MMMLSYAKNMEDVVLSMVFSGQKTGFYIDVGGGHAIADNVSYFFYELGWSGIIIEPQAHLGALYQKVRPRDILVAQLAGSHEGTLELFEANTFHGLSTASPSHANAAEKAGFAGKRVLKPVTTLARLCADHAPSKIDFLKIDVEGHESEVLAGNDWEKYRPKVILVEAIEPITNEDTAHRFEPFLLGRDYRFAHDDGLNRWYVADEAAADMLPRFPKTQPDWKTVRHLGEYGPAYTDQDHPDHALAKALVQQFLAILPALSREQRTTMGLPEIEQGAGARIASLFDGGYILE